MKSNVCKIVNGTSDLAAILKESDKVASYSELTHKQALHLRLICEEIDGMLPNILGDFEGKFWIELEDGVCKVNVSIEILELDASKKEELISLSKDKKNAAAVGILGKIRNAIENFFLHEEAMSDYVTSSGTFYMASGFSECVDYSYVWTLDQYRKQVRSEELPENWDELEKSVIASVADDVIVGVKGKRADIIVVKSFK